MNKYMVVSSGSDYYGPFDDVAQAEQWGEKEEEIVGDFYVEVLYDPNE